MYIIDGMHPASDLKERGNKYKHLIQLMTLYNTLIYLSIGFLKYFLFIFLRHSFALQ